MAERSDDKQDAAMSQGNENEVVVIQELIDTILSYGEYSRSELMRLLGAVPPQFHETFLRSVQETERLAHRDRQLGRVVNRPRMVAPTPEPDSEHDLEKVD